MPNGNKYPRRKTNKEIRREAKAESGKYGGRGRDMDDKLQNKDSKKKKDYSGTAVGNIIRQNKLVKKITGNKYGVKKVGRGSKQDGEVRRDPIKIRKPKLDPVGIKARVYKGDPSGATTLVSESQGSATTRKGVKDKVRDAEGVTGVEFGKETNTGGDKILSKNKAKISDYAKRKAEQKKKKAEIKYVPGSRTDSQTSKDARLDLAKTRLGTRKLFKHLKKKKKEERRRASEKTYF